MASFFMARTVSDDSASSRISKVLDRIITSRRAPDASIMEPLITIADLTSALRTEDIASTPAQLSQAFSAAVKRKQLEKRANGRYMVVQNPTFSISAEDGDAALSESNVFAQALIGALVQRADRSEARAVDVYLNGTSRWASVVFGVQLRAFVERAESSSDQVRVLINCPLDFGALFFRTHLRGLPEFDSDKSEKFVDEQVENFQKSLSNSITFIRDMAELVRDNSKHVKANLSIGPILDPFFVIEDSSAFLSTFNPSAGCSEATPYLIKETSKVNHELQRFNALWQDSFDLVKLIDFTKESKITVYSARWRTLCEVLSASNDEFGLRMQLYVEQACKKIIPLAVQESKKTEIRTALSDLKSDTQSRDKKKLQK